MNSSVEKAMERQGKEASADGAAGFQANGNHTSMDENAARKPYHVDLSGLANQGFLIFGRGAHHLAEEYRMVKRPLLMNAFGKGAAPIEYGNLIMIVSALAGEGKTFTTLNLAMSIAMERDTTVLIVDSDVGKSTLTKLVGLDGRLGLTDILQKSDVRMSDVIIDTDVEKLKIMPSGQHCVNPTELLSSERMRGLARELSERYTDRVILFDSPPLLNTSQACVLSQPMGQILLVVEAGKTTQNAVKEALSLLPTNKVIGLLLNKYSSSLFSSDYSDYEYGYGGKSNFKKSGRNNSN